MRSRRLRSRGSGASRYGHSRRGTVTAHPRPATRVAPARDRRHGGGAHRDVPSPSVRARARGRVARSQEREPMTCVFSEFDSRTLESLGAAHTVREILGQPDLWRATLAKVESERPRLLSFLG